MSRGIRVAAALVALAAPSRATPPPATTAPNPAAVIERAPEIPSYYLLAKAWAVDLPVRGSLVVDWNGRTDRPEGAGRSRASFSISPEIGLPLVRDRWLRLGVIPFGLQFGRWGADELGDVSLLWGARARVNIVTDDLVELHVLAGADFPAALAMKTGATAQIGMRPIAGLGVRAVRFLSLEVGWYPVVPLSTTFHGTEHPAFEPSGLAVTLALDPCAFAPCRALVAAPPKPARRDLRCRLFEAASRACSGASRAQICEKVPDALSSPDDSSREQDGVDAFLTKLEASLGADARAVVQAVAARHGELSARMATFRARARAAAQRGATLGEHWMYAPTVMDLRHFFGCAEDGRAAPSECPDVAAACREWVEDGAD